MQRTVSDSRELALPLANITVALSGAMPDQEHLLEHGWSELDIRMTVLRFVESLLRDGGRLVHGSHPSFVPIIRRAAETQAERFSGQRPVTMYVVAPYVTSAELQRVRAHEWYADVIVIGVPSSNPRSKASEPAQKAMLDEMRVRMIPSANALVCIGGRLAKDNRKVPGVAIEYKIAVDHAMPVYLAAGLGGFTKYVQDTYPTTFANGLTRDENDRLTESHNPTEIVSLVTAGLRHVAEHAAGH